MDGRVLDGYKRRAFRRPRTEYAEVLWGTVDGCVARVAAIQPIAQKGKHAEVEIDPDDTDTDASRDHAESVGLRVLGSIHSHPWPFACEPSNADVESFHQDGEYVMGICALREKGRRRFTSFGFFDGRRQLELTIAETKEKR